MPTLSDLARWWCKTCRSVILWGEACPKCGATYGADDMASAEYAAKERAAIQAESKQESRGETISKKRNECVK